MDDRSKKFMDELAKIDDGGASIFQASFDRKEFDFDRGFELLMKVDTTGLYLVNAGESWFKGFDHKRALRRLIELSKRPDRSPNLASRIREAGRDWPSDKIDLDLAFEALLKTDEIGKDIYEAGIEWRSFKDPMRAFKTVAKLDKEGDYTAGAIVDWNLMDRRIVRNPKEALDLLIKYDNSDGGAIYHAGRNIENFDFKRALEYLKSLKNKRYYNRAVSKWPLSARDTIKTIEANTKGAKKIKDKKIVLENNDRTMASLNKSRDNGSSIYNIGTTWKEFDTKVGLDMLIKKDRFGWNIYKAGCDWPSFDYEKGLDALIEKDKDGSHIFKAGDDWKQFDYEKGFNALIKKQNSSWNIYMAGRYWRNFDYERGFNVLLFKDKTGASIYEAGKYWPTFDKTRALKALKEVSPDKYYKRATEYWKKKSNYKLDLFGREIFESKRKITEERGDSRSPFFIGDSSKAYKIYKGKNNSAENPQFAKRFEELLDSDEYGKWIVMAGYKWKWKDFDYKRAQEKLEVLDDTGDKTRLAGELWKENFDTTRGLRFLSEINTDKSAKYIYEAGNSWEIFDFEEGLEALNKTDKVGSWIFKAGCDWGDWGNFDFELGQHYLGKGRRDTNFLILAGSKWEKFDFEKGLDHLIKKNITGEFIYKAGLEWKEFDFEKGFSAFLDKNSWAHSPSKLEVNLWKGFNQDKAWEILLKKDKTGGQIYTFGEHGKVINQTKALLALKKLSPDNLYKRALSSWDLTAQSALLKTEQEKLKVIKTKDKKLTLGKMFEELKNGR